MDMWTKELADMSEELMNDPMAVVRSLNDARNLCTAGFLMRRQIQVSFPELLGGVSEETGEFYEDLTVNNNVPWPDKLLKTLSSRMEKYMLKEQDEVVKATEWFQWLSDKKYEQNRPQYDEGDAGQYNNKCYESAEKFVGIVMIKSDCHIFFLLFYI